MSKTLVTMEPRTTDQDSLALKRIEILLGEILLRLPKTYSEEDSVVEYPISYSRGDDNDGPEPHWPRPSAWERKMRVNAAIASGSYIHYMQRERDRTIAREEAEGRLEAAKAVRITTEDIKSCARKTMDWIADHADMTNGKLRLGTFEDSGFRCEVNAKVNTSGPSIDFEIDCKF
jgi:hypothetical protein